MWIQKRMSDIQNSKILVTTKGPKVQEFNCECSRQILIKKWPKHPFHSFLVNFSFVIFNVIFVKANYWNLETFTSSRESGEWIDSFDVQTLHDFSELISERLYQNFLIYSLWLFSLKSLRICPERIFKGVYTSALNKYSLWVSERIPGANC